jgi:hypothetical protein
MNYFPCFGVGEFTPPVSARILGTPCIPCIKKIKIGSSRNSKITLGRPEHRTEEKQMPNRLLYANISRKGKWEDQNQDG